jgi:hypothetical protein
MTDLTATHLSMVCAQGCARVRVKLQECICPWESLTSRPTPLYHHLAEADVCIGSHPFPSAVSAGVDAALCLADQLQPHQLRRVQRHACVADVPNHKLMVSHAKCSPKSACVSRASRQACDLLNACHGSQLTNYAPRCVLLDLSPTAAGTAERTGPPGRDAASASPPPSSCSCPTPSARVTWCCCQDPSHTHHTCFSSLG